MACDISIIIVNYNVRHFLEQALTSIKRAQKGLNVETWVVDNASVDDSLAMVRREFPSVRIIGNQDNVGFSKANNQAIKQAQGKYVLLLNPDTVLQEDTLTRCFEFMEKHPKTGAMGVKMIDGSGQFLPESKRGFPSPWVSFCKATGLSRLFSKSRIFNRYHLSYLDENQTHSIDVLCGAFMFMSKSCLDEVGLLDEAFFMYGEDIDLSYRIKLAGYDVIYYPETKIIHFKGESTKKSSVNYVKVFYKAMIIFAQKHFAGKGAGLFSVFLRLAIMGRATMSLLKRFWSIAGGFIMDFILSFTAFTITKEFWEAFYFQSNDYYQNNVFWNFGAYTIIILSVFAFQGIYGKHNKPGKIIRGVLLALLLCLAIYGLLNEEYRSSRAILVLGSFSFLILALIWRYLIAYLKTGKWRLNPQIKKRILIIGSQSEIEKVNKILQKSLIEHHIIGYIAPPDRFQEDFHLGAWTSLESLVQIEKIDEIIYSIRDLEWKNVMSSMNTLGPRVSYKMAGDDQISILGSDSKNTAGEMYTVNFHFNITDNKSKISKRIVELIIAFLLILLFPILVFIKGNGLAYLNNMGAVVLGKKALVGYHEADEALDELPTLKKSVIPRSQFFGEINEQELIHRINLLYAKDYYPWQDVETVIKSWTKLGA